MSRVTDSSHWPLSGTYARLKTSKPDKQAGKRHEGSGSRFKWASLLLAFAWEGPSHLSQSMRMEWRFVSIRWLGILILTPSLPFVGLSHKAQIMALGVIAAAAIYNLVVQIMLWRGSTLFNTGYVTTVCDGLLDLALMSFVGGFDTPLYYILYTVTVSTAMRYGYGPVLGIALLFVSGDLVHSLWQGQAVEGSFFVRSAFLVITAILAGYLHEQTQEAEAALQERLHQANALNQELEAFSYSVSHDLRAPLRSIDGFSQALLEDYNDKLDEEGRDYLNRVRASSIRMAQLIDDLLNLSRVTRSEIRPGLVNLSALTRSIAEGLRQIEPERRVHIVIADHVMTVGDEPLLRAVLENLLNNAWKFTRNCPLARIEFGIQQREGKPWFFVRDNGVGFDMAYVDKLFGAFQRLHSEAEFEGTGIGLATVQRIIHRHGGQVAAESQEGLGAIFYFSLPA